MADRTLSTGVTVAQALGIRPPQRQTLTTGLADLEVKKQEALDRIAGLGAATAPRLRPPPGSAMQPGPDIYYSPSTDRYAAGGMEFGATEYDVALRAMENLQAPTPAPGGDFQRIPASTLAAYRQSISEARGPMGNLAIGARNVGEGLVGGVGRGLQMLGAEEAGQALVDVGEAIGISPAEQARSAAIAERQGLLGQIGTATVQSAPTIGVSVGAGLTGAAAGAAVGGPVGAAIGGLLGVAASIFPMELQSSWEAAEQNGLDPTDPNVQSDILLSTLFKTGVQSAGPAVIARGFSPALRRVVGDVAGRTLGQRITRGVGAGALEGSAEAIAQITDRVVFDPELRAQLNEADIAALAPLVAQKYGQEALVAFGAGFLLGGPLGALGTPTQDGPVDTPAREDTPPRRNVDNGQPIDALSGATLEPQAAPQIAGPEARLGLPYYPEGAPAGLLPAPPAAAPQPAITGPQAPAGLLPAPPAPVQPAGYTGAQAEMFTPAESGIHSAAMQRMQPPTGTPQQLAEGPLLSPGAFTQPEAAAQTPIEVFPAGTTAQQLAAAPLRSPGPFTPAQFMPGQAELDLTSYTAAPPVAAQPTAMGEQLAAIREQQNRMRQQAEQAAATRARREAEFTAAQQQAEQQERQRRVDAEVEWEQLRPEGSRVTFSRLTPSAQREWSEAVAAGTADGDLFNTLRKKVRPGPAQPLLETPTIIEPAAAPSALPEGVFGTAGGKPFKNKADAQSKRKRVASRENVPVERLEPVEVTGGWGLQVQPETPPKGGAPKKGTPDAVRKQGSKAGALRQKTKAGKGVRVKDTKGQEAAGEGEAQAEEARIIEGRGGRREIVPMEPEPEPEPEAPTTAAEGVAAEDLAEVEALIEDVQTTTNDRDAAQSLATLVEWSESGTKAAKTRATEFLTELENDPATARQLEQARVQARLGNEISKARGAVDKARAEAAAGKKGAPKKLAAAEAKLEELQAEARDAGGATKSAADNITDTIEQLNAGGEMSLGLRSKLVRWWSEAKGSDPYYNGRPLTDYISGRADFFNYGPRVNGHRQIVPKGTGRTSRTTFNFTGGKFNNLDGSPVSRSLPHGRAKMLISSFRRKLKRAPTIREFTNVAQLKQKNPALYARAAAARPQGDFDNVTAAGYSFGDGEVIIFTDNVANEAHLRFVLAHETMGHYGLRGFIPASEFDKTMESIYDEFPHIQGPVDAAMARVEGLSKAEAVEEYLSDYAALLETNLLLRVWNAVKNALNALGLKFVDDYPRYLINHARQYARRPGTGHFADMDVIAQRANGVETGTMAPGRYKRSDDLFSTVEGIMSGARVLVGDRAILKKAEKHIITDVPNNMESFKNEFLSLFPFQARKNPGLNRLNEIITSGEQMALYIRNLLDEVMGPALNRAIKIPGTNIEFGGTTKAETTMVNNALAVARIRASQALRDNPKLNQSKTPIFEYDEATGTFKETGEAERIDDLFRIKREEFDTGFTAVLKRDTGEEQPYTYARDPKVTNTDRAYDNYERTRKAMLETHKMLLRSKLEANTATMDGALEEIASFMPNNRVPAEQRRLIRKVARLYSDLYNKGAGIDPRTGQTQVTPEAIAQAEEFLQAFNTAIIADNPASTDTDLKDKNSAASRNKDLSDIIAKVASKQEADDIVASVEKFKELIRKEVTGQPGKYVSGLRNDKYFIQQKIAGLNASQMIASGGEQNFRYLIGSQFTPITQEGKYQARIVPVDAVTGEAVALGDDYGGSVGYTQFATQSEADAFAAEFAAKMVDEAGDVLTFTVDAKGPAGESIETAIRLEARVDEVQSDVIAPTRMNLNEFMMQIARYNISLKPEKRQEIMIDMTRQDDRARKRLLTEFTPGDPRDGVVSISKHIDGLASTIAKTTMRPEIERLMSHRNRRSKELWEGDRRRVDATKARYERLVADPGTSREQVDAARRDYEEAQMMLDETGDMPNKAKNQAGKLLAFINDNESLTESNFDASAFIARWRSLTAIIQLGANFVTAALNPTSVYTNVAPYLATRNSKTAFGGGFGMGKTMLELNRAFKQVGLPGTLPTKESAKFNQASFWDEVRADPALQKKYGVTDFEARMLAQEIRRGSMQPSLTNALMNTARGLSTTAAGRKVADAMMFMFNVSEQASRRAAGIAAFRMEFARRMATLDPDLKGAEYEAAVEQAYQDTTKFVRDMLDLTMGNYATSKRPNFFRGGWPGMLYMYQVFPTTSIQLFRNMDAKGKMWMLAALWMLGGIAAWPFAEEIEDLLDTLDQNFGIGVGTGSIRAFVAQQFDTIMPGLGQLAITGGFGQFLPLDVASRVKLSTIPGTEFFLAGTDRARMYEEIMGPMPSALFGAGAAVVDAIRAPFSPTITMEDVAREAPVTAIRMLADSYAYLNSGAIIDRRGYVVEPELRWYDIAARIAGGYPLSAAEKYGAIRVVNRMVNYRREMSAQYRSEWIQASIRGDNARRREIEEAVREWNRTHRGTPLEIANFRQGAQRALREARRSATERTLRTTPRAGRDEYQGIMDALTR